MPINAPMLSGRILGEIRLFLLTVPGPNGEKSSMKEFDCIYLVALHIPETYKATGS